MQQKKAVIKRGKTPFSPKLVELESRDVPAALFVDPNFTSGGTLTFTGVGSAFLPSGGLTFGVDAFSSIRSAVEAANLTPADDQIYLASETFDVNPNSTPVTPDANSTTVGTITLDPTGGNLSITGQGITKSTIQVSQSTDAQTGPTGYVFMTKGPRLDLTGFTFTGRSTEADVNTGSPIYQVGGAFRYQGGSGDISNILIRDIAFTTPGPLFFGTGVVAFGAASQVNISNSEFLNIGNIGVNFYSTDTTASTVSGSKFIGPYGGSAYGIQVAEGSTNITITGNDISNYQGTTTGFTSSAGITVLQSSTNVPSYATIIGNSLHDNTFAVLVGDGLATDDSAALIQHNNIVSNTNGIGALGSGAVNALFNWWGSTLGPQAADNPNGIRSGFVDPAVLYKDANIAPNQGILQSATPVLTATSPENYRDQLTKGTVTITTSKTDTNGNSLLSTASYDQFMTGVGSNSFQLGGTLASSVTAVNVITKNSVTYGVTVLLPTGSNGTITLTAPAATTAPVTLATSRTAPAVAPNLFAPVNLYGTHTNLFGGATASNTQSINVDNTAPVGSFVSPTTQVPISTTQNNPLTVTFTYTEVVTGLSATDIVLSSSGASSTAAANVLSFTPAADGKSFTVVIGNFSGAGDLDMTVNGGVATDAAGNTAAVFNQVLGTVDLVPPSVTVVGPTSNVANGPVTATLTFSEPVTGLTASSFVVTGTAGGSVTNLTASANNLTYTVTIGNYTQDGTVSVSLPAAAGADAAGNPTPATSVLGVTIDTVSPIGTITDPTTPTTVNSISSNTVSVTVTFTEVVTGFDASAVTVTSGTGSTATASVLGVSPNGDGKNYTVIVGNFAGTGSVTLTVAGGKAKDAAGNAAATFNGSIANVDLVPPTVTVVGPTSNFANGPVTATLTFSKPVTGLTASSFVVSGTAGGSVTNLTASADNLTYTVTIGNYAQDGTVSVSLPAAAGADAAGNPTPATSVLSVSIDTVSPIGSITAPTTPTTVNSISSNTVSVTVTFTEVVTGFDASAVTVGSGTGSTATASVLGVSSTGNGKTYNVIVGNFAGTGSVTLTVADGKVMDAAGNKVTGFNGSIANVDLVPPTVTVTGPTSNITNGPVTATLTFSKPVTGVSIAKFVVTGTAGGSVINLTASTDNKTYTVTIGDFTADGTVSVSLPAAAGADAAGNPTPATSVLSVSIDTVLPVGSITAPTTPVIVTSVANSTVPVTITFTEAVTGFDASAITLASGTGSTATASVLGVTPSTDGKTYTVIVGNFAGAGAVTLTVAGGKAKDSAGNAAATFNGSIATVDLTVPTIVSTTVTKDATGKPTALVITYSKPVAGIDSTAITVTGATAGTPTTTDNKTFTIPISSILSSSSQITVSLAAGASKDANGNPSAAFNTSIPLPTLIAASFAAGSGEATPGGNNPQSFFLINNNYAVVGGNTPFESTFTGGVRVATADLNGDGILDAIVASGPGRVGEVLIYDGKNTSTPIARYTPFESSFTGGLFVSSMTLNGKVQVIVTPDNGGGPRVQIVDGLSVFNGKATVTADFFGIPDPSFRGGARASAGDLNGDGNDDLIVAAGSGGGPRIATYDGSKLKVTGGPIMNDFFAFPDTIRDGVYVGAGDINGDGKADLIVGAGPGGGPRVKVFSGLDLTATASKQTVISDFFAGDVNNRGGVRVSTAHISSTSVSDLVTAPGVGGGSKISVYSASSLTSSSTPSITKQLSLFNDFTNGVFVG